MTENKDYRNGYADGFLDGFKLAITLTRQAEERKAEQVTITCDDSGPKTYSGGEK